MSIDYETIKEMDRTRPAPEMRDDTAIVAGKQVAIMPNGGLDLGRRNDDTIDGARTLDLIASLLKWYGRWPNDESLIIATLFVAALHFVDDSEPGRLVFDAIARLMFIAPKGSGKTRMMRVLRALAHRPTGIIVPPTTAPGLKEALANGKVPFVDELQRIFGRGTANQAIQGLLTGGYTQDSGTLNARGGENAQNVFGAWVLGARPSIITATRGAGNTDEDGPLADLFERSFIITPKRSYDKSIPDLDGDFQNLTRVFNELLELWGAQERPVPTDEDDHPKLWPIHTMPESLTGRQREISMALCAVADRAVAHDPNDPNPIRWSIWAREATEKMLVGHGNDGAEILADIERKMKAMGISLDA